MNHSGGLLRLGFMSTSEKDAEAPRPGAKTRWPKERADVFRTKAVREPRDYGR